VAIGGNRNNNGLNERQIQRCQAFWSVLGGTAVCELDISEATFAGSKTRFVAERNLVLLGSDAYPGSAPDPRSRMSMSACLAHELAHADRYRRDIRRPYEMPDYLVEEAEASIHGSFYVGLESVQRRILIEDARDQLDRWLRES
jgi:hypothetical protein